MRRRRLRTGVLTSRGRLRFVVEPDDAALVGSGIYQLEIALVVDLLIAYETVHRRAERLQIRQARVAT